MHGRAPKPLLTTRSAQAHRRSAAASTEVLARQRLPPHSRSLAPALPQHSPPASTRKKLSISASVPKSPSLLKSADPHEAQQFPAKHAKNASMSASVPISPSPLKSELQHGPAGAYRTRQMLAPRS